MLIVPKVWQAIFQDDWFATIDLEDTYFFPHPQLPGWLTGSEEQCCNSVTQLLQYLEHLGLHLNMKKSRLYLTQSAEFLGMWLE